jgi:SagB-type dehydrogenase family enzyme
VSTSGACAREYLEAVYRRGRVPMESERHIVDWHDQPAWYKTYPDAVRLSLPPAPAPLTRGDHAGAALGQNSPWDLGTLGALLQLSYGPLSRRLRIDWNEGDTDRAWYGGAIWSRGAASGGGLYPLEIYWAPGRSGPVLPGIYHYAPAMHAMERLALGDHTSLIREAAQHHPAAEATDQFLLVSVRFWRNSFKYSNFSYHVVTQDVGALLGTWAALLKGSGHRCDYLFWFRDQDLNTALGLGSSAESVFALIALPSSGTGGGQPAAPRRPVIGGRPAVRPRSPERSKTVRRFPLAEQMHASALVTGETRPEPAAIASARPGRGNAGQMIVLPAAPSIPLSHADGVTARRSSFGLLSARAPLGQDELAAVLASAASLRDHPCDYKPDTDPRGCTGLLVAANRVQGVPAGVYAYDDARHGLEVIARRPVAQLLQRSYLLQNYNLDQAAAVLAIEGRPERMLEIFGDRGYRILNAEVGVLAEAVYLAAASLGIGCGAVLGLDFLSMNELFGLDGTDRRTLLFLLLGHERHAWAEVDGNLT